MIRSKRAISPAGFIDIKEVARRLGIGKTSAWMLAKECADFPKKVKFGARTTRWRAEDVDAWLEKRIADAIDAGR